MITEHEIAHIFTKLDHPSSKIQKKVQNNHNVPGKHKVLFSMSDRQ